jgi:hypothetical protein
LLRTFKSWLDIQVHAVLPKSALGNAVLHTIKNWDALGRYTEAGYIEPDNNYAEQCFRPVALRRKNFLFVGFERAGQRDRPVAHVAEHIGHVGQPARLGFSDGFKFRGGRDALGPVFPLFAPCDCRGHLQPRYARAERHLRRPDVGPVQGRIP